MGGERGATAVDWTGSEGRGYTPSVANAVVPLGYTPDTSPAYAPHTFAANPVSISPDICNYQDKRTDSAIAEVLP